VRWFKGVPSPVKRPQDVDMVIFRENTEDIYAGIEWAGRAPRRREVLAFLQDEMGVKKIRFPETSRHRHQAHLRDGTERLVRAAISTPSASKRKSVTSCTRATS
jgi:isocitrate dehydrogenase